MADRLGAVADPGPGKCAALFRLQGVPAGRRGRYGPGRPSRRLADPPLAAAGRTFNFRARPISSSSPRPAHVAWGVPSAAVRIDAYPGLITENTVAEARRQLRRVDALTNRTKLAALLPRGQSTPTPVVYAVANQTADNRQAMRRGTPTGRAAAAGPRDSGLRSQTISSVSNASVQLQAANNYNYLRRGRRMPAWDKSCADKRPTVITPRSSRFSPT